MYLFFLEGGEWVEGGREEGKVEEVEEEEEEGTKIAPEVNRS